MECNNADKGCQWIGELRSVEKHQQICSYTLLVCMNECKKDGEMVKILRKDFAEHHANECPRRQHRCKLCGEVGEYEDITNTHIEFCTMFEVRCKNDQCEVILPRWRCTTLGHICDYEKIPCKYSELGCKERPFRKELKKHEEDDQLHLQTTRESVLQHKTQIQQLTRENTELKIIVQTMSKKQFTFKLPSFTEMKSNNEIFCSAPFYTSQHGYKFCISVHTNGNSDGEGTHLSVFAYLMKGDNDDSLTWPFTGMITIELLNQLEDKNHYTITYPFPANSSSSKRVTDGESGVGFGRPKFIAHSDLQENYLVNDTLFFRVTVDVSKYKPWLECTRTD